MDFKGEFILHNGRLSYRLTVCDDHRRSNVVLEGCANMKTATVQRHLRGAFERYGLPKAILCDNGAPWSSNWTGGYARLEVWLTLHGINRIHGRLYHPQTQGKEERFHKTLKVEFKVKRLRVGKARAGRMGALRPRGEQLWEMCFASTLIGIYDLSETPPRLVAIRPQQKKER